MICMYEYGRNYCEVLFQDDIITATELELIMSAGLGRQYAFLGPVEALYLDSGSNVLFLYKILSIEKIPVTNSLN